MEIILRADMVGLILAAAVATYLTRIGGYVLIIRMRRIPPRLDAALNAVPAAVLTTLVAPAFFYGGLDVKTSIAVALVASLRFSLAPMLLIGWATVMLIRYVPMPG